jgi:DNA processing protein
LDPCIFRFMLASAAAGRHAFPTRRLFESFRSPAGILQAPPSELEKIKGLHASTLQALVSAGDRLQDQKPIDLLKKEEIRLISYECLEYPDLLRTIPDPPPVLFLKGRILPEDFRSVAVIGSRRASAYGTAVGERLVRELVGQGFTIISGMARGIDTAAHWCALESGGRTGGVLGTGLDVTYPRTNAHLFSRIPRQGFLVSEYLPGTQPRPENFPRRNRIISGLAWGVLVVEASERSGTMITVRMALEQGREVFAVPGDVRSPTSRGTHRLIQQGAKLVEGVDDILEELSHLGAWGSSPDAGCADFPSREEGERPVPQREEQDAAAPMHGMPEERKALVQLLNDSGTGLDTLVRRTGWEMQRLSVLLTELELSGQVKRLPGNRYVRSGPGVSARS